MECTNIKTGDLIICTNNSMLSYLKIAEILEINYAPHDCYIESVKIAYRELFGGCDNWFERVKKETIKYKDFEYSFKKINCELAY